MPKKFFPRVLGVYLGHDLGACLLQGGEIAAMIEEERLNRFKHGRPDTVAGLWPHFAGRFGYVPWASISYCLETAGLGIDDLDRIVFGDNLWASGAAETIRELVPIKDRSKVTFTTEPDGGAHHLHHALSAFCASPFEEAAVLVVDADGNTNASGYEAESGYCFENRRGDHRVVFKNRYTEERVPKSGIGWMYEQTTYLLGFANPRIFLADAGKTMGLAAYGGLRPELEEPWLEIDGHRIDFSGFHRWLRDRGFDRQVLDRTTGLAKKGEGIDRYAMDVAHKVQLELERGVFALAEELHRRTGAKNLCLAGGVALNSVANGLLLRRGPFERIFVQPAANDAGQALGLAYRGHLELARDAGGDDGIPEVRPMRHAYGGRHYPPDRQEELLRASGLEYERLGDEGELVADAAGELAGGGIVAWFQGGSELGPRALGHRSILADPSPEGMKDQLNARVKFRESFRPFAPSVLLERAAEVFELEGESPYMLIVAPVREEWRSRVPAICHVDGTARIQTVDPEVEPLYHRLISAFAERTGVPLVLNTSFNLRGMPIVESPRDALGCFLATDLDHLYLGPFKLSRPGLDRVVPRWHPEWRTSIVHGRNGDDPRFEARHANGRRVSEPIPGALAELLGRLDGSRTLAAAHRASGVDGEVTEQEAWRRVQGLARSGVLELAVGELVFGQPEEGRHWWQR